MPVNLDDYNDVPSRIAEFRELYPEGTLQQVDLQFVDLGGQWYVCFTAAAFRSPTDERPGMGTAWELVPGKTSFTRDSEVQNAETSAWGRAIIAVGAADAKKVASREEVRNRTAGGSLPEQLLSLLEESKFKPAEAREIIGAALGKLVTKLEDIKGDEYKVAIEAIESAIVDRDMLEENGND